MTLDELSTVDLEAAAGEVVDVELAVTDDVLVKAFVLGAHGEIEPHEHPESTNVLHVLRGTVTIRRDEAEDQITAPGVVSNDRGVVHGVQNDTDDLALITASLCPFPG